MPSPYSFECGQSGGVVQGHGRHPVGAWPLGGKDSTALTMHLLETMEQLPPPVRNRKRVYITCVNTLVEAPPVIDHVHKFIERLKLYIEDRALPVEVIELVPEHEQTFWSNLIRARLSNAGSRLRVVHGPHEDSTCSAVYRGTYRCVWQSPGRPLFAGHALR